LALATAVVHGADTPPVVRSVTFEGRREVPEDTLRALAGIEPGAEWTEERGREALRRLLGVPWLASVSPPRVTAGPEGVDVLFTIREQELVGDIEFDGNEFLEDRKLAESVGLRPGDPFLDETVTEAVERLLALYHAEGFLLASVESIPVARGAGNVVDITFSIAEGRTVFLEEVRVRGARAISEEEAWSAMGLEPRRLLGLISRGLYVPERADEYLARLRSYYRRLGHLDAEVSFGGLEIDPGGRRARVTIDVQEGPQYTLAGARIEGARLFPARLLERELGLGRDVPWSEEAIQEAYLRLVRWYEGHSDVLPRIEVKEILEPGWRMTVVFAVDEARRHVENGTVTITGNAITRDRVIRRHVALVPGQHFTPAEARRTREALLQTGYFESVEVEDSRGSDPERPTVEVRDITVDVKEKEMMRMLYYGGGVSSGRGGYGLLKVRDENFDLFRLPVSLSDWRGAFQGGGQVLEVEIIPGGKESLYRAHFEEPYFFRSDLALTLDGGTSILEREEHTESRLRGAAGVRHYLDRAHRASLSLQWIADLVRIHDLDPAAPPDAVAAEGRALLSYPRAELRWSDRDSNFFSGDTGFLAKLSGDAGGGATGSELDFARVEATAAFGIGLFDRRPDHRHVLEAGVTAGLIEGIGGDEVPLFERWYLGGPSTFRGFEYRRLGPHQGDTPVGGAGLLHGTVRYSMPLYFRELRAFAMFDWGDLESDFGEISTGRFRTAAGGGLSVRLRILGNPLPANFYWMKALSSEAGDEEEVFSFSLGFGF